MNPAVHYMTNHLWEDYVRYGPMYFLVQEGSEGTNPGERNTWESLLIKLAAAVDLTAGGYTARLRSTSQLTLHAALLRRAAKAAAEEARKRAAHRK
eukprot:m51a1_g6323 hypothetical protein (96) ;mRNA; f:364961-365346